jgi:hypothetical protein
MKCVRLWLLLGLVVFASPAAAQSTDACLHSRLESPAEARRRQDALRATRMINTLTVSPARGPGAAGAYPSWEELARSPQLASLRSMGGPAGDLARKIQWGTQYPLPGWAIHYVASAAGYAFSLTDVLDPCRFTYHSDDSGMIIAGESIDSNNPRVVPLS